MIDNIIGVNPYSHLKEKNKEYWRESSYINNMLIVLNSILEWNFEDEDITKRINIYRALNGHCGITTKKYNGKYLIGMGSYTGDLDAYGIGSEYLMTFPGVGSLNLEIDKDVIVFPNNSTYSPEINIYRLAEILGEVDKSMLVTVKKSRLSPIPLAENKTEKAAIMNAMKRIDNGELDVIMSNQFLKNLDGSKESLLNLTAPEGANYLHILSNFSNTLKSTFYQTYGYATNNIEKSAQISTEELNKDDSISMILPLDMLNQCENAIKKWNAITGENVKVKLGKMVNVNLEQASIVPVEAEEGVETDDNSGNLE